MNMIDALRESIVQYLYNMKINVGYFNVYSLEAEGNKRAVMALLKIDDKDEPKWNYLIRRVNDRIPDLPRFVSKYADGEFIITLGGDNDSFEEDVLKARLESFREGVYKQYFRVSPKRNIFSVLIKPTHRCNLDCKYCYDKPYRMAIKEDMSMETLDRILKLLSEYAEKIQLIWHGGEPTVVGIKWFEQAYKEVISNYPIIEFDFKIMSNGVNIDENWLNFFDKFNIAPGVSYNAMYQAKIRVTSQIKKNSEADEKISSKIEETLINSKKHKHCIGVIDVITKKNYKDIIKLYEYYKSIGISPAFNTIFRSRQSEKNDMEIVAADYSKHLLKYFKYWLYDKNGIYERTAAELLEHVIGGNEFACTCTDCRYMWLGFNPVGDVYPCDRYYPDKYKIGSVFEYENIEDMFKSKPYQFFVNETQRRFDTKCKECGYFFTCHGGCNGSAVEATGSAEGTEEFYCQTFRLNFLGAYEILRNVNVLEDELNPFARQLMIKYSFYSVKEIKEFLDNQGIQVAMEYNPKDLLNCSEYEIFRGINYVKDKEDGDSIHTDYVHGDGEEILKSNKDRRVRDLLNYLSKLSEEFKEKLNL